MISTRLSYLVTRRHRLWRQIQDFPTMKTKLCFAIALLGAIFFTSGCSTVNKVPVVGSLIPDLTNPAELRDASEIAGALVLEANPSHVADIDAAVTRAEEALKGELITRAEFDLWVNDLLTRNVKSAFARAFIRQRFAKAWDENHQLLDVSGLVLKNPKHRELAEAFVAGLRAAVNDFNAARATSRINELLERDTSAAAVALRDERRRIRQQIIPAS